MTQDYTHFGIDSSASSQKPIREKPRICHAWVICLAVTAGAASAQTFPSKPVRIITSDPGGASDFAARILAQGITVPLGQPVIVENRGSILSIELVVKAPPDGYSLLLAGSNFYTTPLLRATSYDPSKDFSPVINVVSAPQLLVVHPSLPLKSVKDLIALAKARPGALNFGSAGIGNSSHLAAEIFKSMAGINIVHIPYKGTAQAVTDLVGGQLQLMFPSGSSVAAYIKAGRLRALAVTSAGPSTLFPGLPPVSAAVPGYESSQFNIVMAPAQTPPAIINRLNQEMRQVLNRADMKERVFNTGYEVVASSPDQLGATIKAEIARIGIVIKNTGIRVD